MVAGDIDHENPGSGEAEAVDAWNSPEAVKRREESKVEGLEKARLKRRRTIVKVGVASVLVVLVIALFRIPGNPGWACGSRDDSSGCVRQSALDVSSLGSEFNFVYGLDVSNDGTKVVASVAHGDDFGERGLGSPKSFIAVFDAGTGEATMVLAESDGRGYQRPVFSGDDSMVAVGSGLFDSEVDPDTDDKDRRVTIFDSSTGEVVQEIEADTGGQIGFFDSDSQLAAGGLTYSVSTGEPTFDETNRHPVEKYWLADWVRGPSRHGTWLIGPEIRINPMNEEQRIVEVLLPETPAFDGDGVGVSPSGEFGVLTAERSYGFWGSVRPRATKPSGSVAVVDIETGQALQLVDFGHNVTENVAWSENSEFFAVVDENLNVSVFAPPE